MICKHVNKVKLFSSNVSLAILLNISHFFYTQLNDQTVLFVTIQFSISHLFTLNTPGQSGPGSNGNKGVLRIPQSSNITGALPSDC